MAQDAPYGEDEEPKEGVTRRRPHKISARGAKGAAGALKKAQEMQRVRRAALHNPKQKALEGYTDDPTFMGPPKTLNPDFIEQLFRKMAAGSKGGWPQSGKRLK